MSYGARGTKPNQVQARWRGGSAPSSPQRRPRTAEPPAPAAPDGPRFELAWRRALSHGVALRAGAGRAGRPRARHGTAGWAETEDARPPGSSPRVCICRRASPCAALQMFVEKHRNELPAAIRRAQRCRNLPTPTALLRTAAGPYTCTRRLHACSLTHLMWLHVIPGTSMWLYL